MDKEKIKKKLIEKWEKIENDVDLVNMIDDIIEDTAKVILEEIEKIINDSREIIKDYNFEDEILKGEARQNFMTIVEMKVERIFKEQFGVK